MFFNTFICVLMLSAVLARNAQRKVTDEEYASMPSLFHLDDFDNCILLGQNALYCSITVQLAPINSKNHSDVWEVISEVTKHEKNYRHDRLRHGICVPESCPQLSKNISRYKNNEQLLKDGISECYSEKYKNLDLKCFVTDMHCETTEPFYCIDVYDVLVGIFLITLLLAVVFASFYERFAKYKSKDKDIITSTTFEKIILCFSLPNNWKRLGSKNTNPDANSLKCINGVRFYNMTLVIMTHACMVCFAGPISNPQFVENITDSSLNMLVVNGNFAVQTFFLMAGLLLSYHFFKTFEGRKEVKFSYILIVFINRYIRLTPCLLVMVAISGTWLYHLGRGPSWDKAVGDEYRNCRQNWWTNLLYINNYYNPEHICMQQSWYLATDTQLFLLSLIIVTFMWKYKKHIKVILGTTLIVGILIPGIINYIYDYDIVVRQYPESLYNALVDLPQWHIIFASGYTNIGGYTIGLIFGLMFYKYRQQEILTRKLYVVIWWILTWGLPLSVIFVGIPIYSESYHHSRFGAAVYVSFARNIFALGIAIAIFGVSQGVGCKNNYILFLNEGPGLAQLRNLFTCDRERAAMQSRTVREWESQGCNNTAPRAIRTGFLRDAIIWSPLQVLGRLTYCVYLVHVAFMRVRGGQTRSPVYMSNYSLFTQTFGDLIVSYMFAALLCLFVEMPISALQKLLVPQLERTRKHVSEKSSAHVNQANDDIDNHQVSKV